MSAMNDEWARWVAKVTGQASARQVSAKVGRSHTTVLRWMREPSPDAAVHLGLAYNVDIMGGLHAAGLISREDMVRLNMDDTIREIATVKLTGELHRRALAARRPRGL